MPCRIFIVGFPRSGTTLMQQLVGSDPSVLSVPETHFFSTLYPISPIKNMLSHPAVLYPRAKRNLEKALGIKIKGRNLRFTESSIYRVFSDEMDIAAHRMGKTSWCEKTPRHLHFAEKISAAIPGSTFIHLIRDPGDAIISLYHATNSYPREWSGLSTGYSIAYCIDRWVNDIVLTSRFRNKKQHLIISYDKFTASPAEVAMKLGESLELNLNPNKLARHSDVVSTAEPWKLKNKFNSILKNDSKNDSELILSKISEQTLNLYRTLLAESI
ncbi:sulfotransferase [bacterium]|nr:sulfotransferase [bacterium]